MPASFSTRELITGIFGNSAHPLAQSFAAWAELPAFRAFAQEYQPKIRKKLRNARDEAGLADLAWELELAHRLLSERVFALAYEQGGVGERRGPDFVATLKGHTTIGVEATRMRQTTREQEHAAEKLGDIVCAKLGQMLANMPNMLAVRVAAETFPLLDTSAAMKLLVQRIDRRDETLLAWRSFESPAAFHKLYRRLSAILVCAPAERGMSCALWLNSQAQHPLPAEAVKALKRA